MNSTPRRSVSARPRVALNASLGESRLRVLIICAVFLFVTVFAQPATAQRIKTLPTRIKAPSLDGGLGWVNTSAPLNLRQLRGKFVVLDFWTYCCINCMQILPDLHKLEEKYADQMVVIGVHSAKFFTEGDTKNIREAVLRYEIDHPVVNDARQTLWKKYEVNVWPSLRIIDPEGFVIATHSGEVSFATLDAFFSRAIASYRRKRLLDETPLRFELEKYSVEKTPLKFPGKVYADEKSDRLFISDSSHNRIVVTKLDGTLVDVIGTGLIGQKDGGYDQATFDHPQGMCLHNGALYVADTENHLIRKIDLAAKQVSTIAGTGRMSRDFVVRSSGRPTGTSLSSPWAVHVHDDELYIAMAGKHQIWKMTRDGSKIFPYAGSCAEDIIDGSLLSRTPFQKGYAAFAQPSGLTSDGRWLFVADSEGSSIRAVPYRSSEKVLTVIGTSKLRDKRLFTFGDREGKAGPGMLQHPIGVAHHDGRIYVSDTYNNKIKMIDLKTLTLKTIAGDFEPGKTDDPPRFDEPAGLSVAGRKLFVADTNNHLVRAINLDGVYGVKTLQIEGLKPPEIEYPAPAPPSNAKQVEFPATILSPVDNELKLSVNLTLPAGYKLNPGAPIEYLVDIIEGDKIVAASVLGKSQRVELPTTQLSLGIPLAATQGTSKLRVTMTYYYCGEGVGSLCKIGGVSWTGHIKLSATSATKALSLKHIAQ